MIGAALVTGAGSGIGRAIARALAAEGTRVCLTGRRVDMLRETGSTLPARLTLIHPGDLTREEDTTALIAAVRDEFGHLDALVHCAGTFVRGRPSSTPVTTLDEQLRIHVRGPLRLTQAALPLLRARLGQIVFIGSSATAHPRAETAYYGIAKAAQSAMATALRDELGREGVRVCTIHPGRTASPMQAAVHVAEGRAYDPDRLMQPDDVAAMVIAVLNLPRTAEVTDLHVRPTRPLDGEDRNR